jgi:hypothetical protein
MLHRKSALFTIASIVLLIPAAISLGTGGLHRPNNDAFAVVQSYLKASYARDYPTAYRYISSQDQRVWDGKSYARQFGSLSGFALELAQRLADSMEIRVINRQISSDRAHYEVGYQVPTADEVSPLLFDWDQDKLNALSRPQQVQLLEALEKIKKNGKMVTIKGQETFVLIAEGGHWRIFYDWASANKVSFTVALPHSAGIDAQLLNDELLVKKDEPFQIAIKVKNRGKQAVVARIIHHIEPSAVENSIEMIACGALLPLVLQPEDTQEISMAYLIRERIRPGMKLTVTYELKLEPMRSNSGLTNARGARREISPRAA